MFGRPRWGGRVRLNRLARHLRFVRIKLAFHAQRKIQIEWKGSALQRAFYFFHEALNDRLPVREKVDARQPLTAVFDPRVAFVRACVTALQFGNA
jgi:hypothetical protein